MTLQPVKAEAERRAGVAEPRHGERNHQGIGNELIHHTRALMDTVRFTDP